VANSYFSQCKRTVQQELPTAAHGRKRPDRSLRRVRQLTVLKPTFSTPTETAHLAGAATDPEWTLLNLIGKTRAPDTQGARVSSID
jgi:hypothetical protein